MVVPSTAKYEHVMAQDFVPPENRIQGEAKNIADVPAENQTGRVQNAVPLAMAVQGIYARDKVPRKEELPEDYGLKDVTKDQVFCRRRMKTRPLSEKCDEEEEASEENDSDYEQAMFIPNHGLVGSLFYHADIDEHESDDESDDEEDDEDDDEDWEDRIYEERTILFQATEHYEELLASTTMSKFFKRDEEATDAPTEETVPTTPEEDLRAILENPRFGEQVIVKGCQSSQIAIGDIFQVNDQKSPLTVEITSPRLACAWVDKRNGSPYGMRGVKCHVNNHALAGWFARVLVGGELREGMEFVRTAHPHPKWTLTYISTALYGEGDRQEMARGLASWNRDVEELRELCALRQLGRYEWKDEAKYILKNLEKEKGKTIDGGKTKSKEKSEEKELKLKEGNADSFRQLQTVLKIGCGDRFSFPHRLQRLNFLEVLLLFLCCCGVPLFGHLMVHKHDPVLS